jgi:putative transposase
MTNHIHLVAIPDDTEGLALCLQRVHGRYAQYLNARRQRSGHLWQNRFFSCPLDEDHLWRVLRYVERNPVRANMVPRAWDYAWSSARVHLGEPDWRHLLDLNFWKTSERAPCNPEEWRQTLVIEEDESERRRIRRATFSGQPLGSEEFIKAWRRPTALAA